jgi:outer membrane protein assembly factor BamB
MYYFQIIKFLFMLNSIVLMSFLLLCVSFETINGQISQWRGPNRDGIYSERGLLKKWPDKGPEKLWSFEGLGAGHGSVGLAKDKIFVLGMPDTTGVLYTFDYSGKLLWKKQYGLEWHENYTGPRSTPVIIGDRIYFESGMGVVYCYNANTGDKIWSVDLLKEFNAKNITWGMAESLLIAGDRLFCTPGGKENNIVALDRFTGKTIWTSPGNGQPSAYCSPVLVKHNKTSLIVTMTAESIVGVDAVSGQFYWQVPQFQGNKIHANTPVYSNGIIFCSSDYDKTNCGIVALKLSDDAKSVTIEWRNEGFKNLMGGIIVKDGYIYGSMYRKGLWCCLRASDGKILYSSDKLGDGNIIMTDDLFYCYSEIGEMALVKASPSAFDVISKFQVPLGTDQHWSHPVIYQGKLYLRHGNALMTYSLK